MDLCENSPKKYCKHNQGRHLVCVLYVPVVTWSLCTCMHWPSYWVKCHHMTQSLFSMFGAHTVCLSMVPTLNAIPANWGWKSIFFLFLFTFFFFFLHPEPFYFQTCFLVHSSTTWQKLCFCPKWQGQLLSTYTNTENTQIPKINTQLLHQYCLATTSRHLCIKLCKHNTTP